MAKRKKKATASQPLTEAEWRACANPTPMLELLREASDRKCRLFCCACCRRIWHVLTDQRCRRAVETAEQFAEQKATHSQLEQASEEVATPRRDNYEGADQAWFVVAYSGYQAALLTVGDSFYDYDHDCVYSDERAIEGTEPHPKASRRIADERLAQCNLLRDIFGYPFRKMKFDKKWRTDTALSLARQMYDAREFSAMPILADALQDAGCDSDDILDHCRGPGPHVRGCWVVDLVLGKE